jgi:hypothetical protein
MSAAKRKDIAGRHEAAQEFIAKVYREVFHQELPLEVVRSAAAKLARALPDNWSAIRKGEA